MKKDFCIYLDVVQASSPSPSRSSSAWASLSVLWKVLFSAGPKLTPTEAVNYQRWQRSLHLATITHIPQPHSNDLQSRPPPRFREGAEWGTSRGGGGNVCEAWLVSLSTYQSQRNILHFQDALALISLLWATLHQYIYIFIYFLTHQVIEKLLKVHLEIKNVQDEYIQSTHLSDFLFLRLCINKLVLK